MLFFNLLFRSNTCRFRTDFSTSKDIDIFCIMCIWKHVAMYFFIKKLRYIFMVLGCSLWYSRYLSCRKDEIQEIIFLISPWKRMGSQWNHFINAFVVRTHNINFHGVLRGWSGMAKVSCILPHRGVQLILAYSWARPAILVAGKGRGGMFLFLLFLHSHSCSSFFPIHLFHLLYYLFYLFSPFLWETTQNDPQGLTCC